MEDSEIDTLIEVAVDHFWAVVAEAAKEHTKSDDLSTDVAVRFRNAAEAAIRSWVRINVENAKDKIKKLRRKAAALDTWDSWVTVAVCSAALEGDNEAIKAVGRILDKTSKEDRIKTSGCGCCKETGHAGPCCPGWLHMDDPYEIQCCDECAKRCGLTTKGVNDDTKAKAKHDKECGCDWGKCQDCDDGQEHAVGELVCDGTKVTCNRTDSVFPAACVPKEPLVVHEHDPGPRCPLCKGPMHVCKMGGGNCWHCDCTGHRRTK